MPMYEYHCTDCDKRFELLVRSTTVPACPACGSTVLEKFISAPQAPGKSAGILQRARQQASSEGHFSNYSQAERSKRGV